MSDAIPADIQTLAYQLGSEGRNYFERTEAIAKAIFAERQRAQWQPMDTAPLDGKHCILSVQEDAFIVSVQGFYHHGKWIAVHRGDVQPLAWMPNILLPDALCPPSFRNDALNTTGAYPGGNHDT